MEPYVECFLKEVKNKRWHSVLDGVFHNSLKRLMNRRVDSDTEQESKLQVWVHISHSSPEQMKNAICQVCVLMSHNLTSKLPINTRIIRINLLLKMIKNHPRMSFFFLNPLLLIFIFPSHPTSKIFCSVLSSFSPNICQFKKLISSYFTIKEHIFHSLPNIHHRIKDEKFWRIHAHTLKKTTQT